MSKGSDLLGAKTCQKAVGALPKGARRSVLQGQKAPGFW